MGRRTWAEDDIRALGARTDVETAGSILGLSRTQAYERAKAGAFPVPVIPVGYHLVVPVAPILRLLQLDADTPGETGPAAVDPDQLADLVADRVVSRLAAAMAGAARADPQPGAASGRALKSVAAGDPEAA